MTKSSIFYWVISIEIIRRAGRLLLIPILAKHYGPIDYGIWTQVGVTVEILSILAGLELKSAVGMFIAGKPHTDQQENFWSSLLSANVFAVFISIIPILLRHKIAILFFGGIQNADYVALGCILMIVSINLGFIYGYFRTLLQLKTTLILLSLEIILSVLLYVIATTIGKDLKIIVCINIAIQFLLFLIGTFIVVKRLGFTFPKFSNISPILKFCLPLIPTMALHWVYNSSDRYFLSYLGYFKDLGIYAIGYTIGYFPVGFLFAPVFFIMPGTVYKLWNEGHTAKALEVMQTLLKYSVVASIYFIITVYILRNFIVSILSSSDFLRAESIVLPISLGYLILHVGDFYMSVLTMLKKTLLFPLLYALPAISNILLNLWWIPISGINGAAWATAVSMLILALTNFIVCKRYIKINFSIPKLFLVLIIGIVGFIPAYLIKSVNIYTLILSFLIFSFIYIIGCFGLKIIKVEELKSFLVAKSSLIS